MQPFVQSVFIVVISVIGTLLTIGLAGILAILAMDRQVPAPHEPGTQWRRNVDQGTHSVDAGSASHVALGASA
jgi:hypothetical protein